VREGRGWLKSVLTVLCAEPVSEAPGFRVERAWFHRLKLNNEANRFIQTLLSISPCGATPRMLPPHRHGLTLIHFSGQPQPFLPLNPSKVANKQCLRLAEKWTSVSPCTPAKCTTGEVASIKEAKTAVGHGRIACPDHPENSLSTNHGHDTMMDCQLTNQGAYLVHNIRSELARHVQMIQPIKLQ